MPRRAARMRRTQEERTAAMRERVLDAAVDCLAAHGYAGTTTVEVAKCAGVSRGAQLHHFPTREALVTAAMQHCHERRIAEFRTTFKSLSPHADPIAAGIDLLWSMFASRDFYAYLELSVAARTDPALRRALVPVTAQFDAEALATARELFPVAADREPLLRLTLSMSFFLMEGMALERIVDDNTQLRSHVLDLWKTLLMDTIAAPADGGSHGRTDNTGRTVDTNRLAKGVARAARTRRRSDTHRARLRNHRRTRRPHL